MKTTLHELHELLDARDLPGFLKLFAAEGTLLMAQGGTGLCTQRILPAVLREMFTANRVTTESMVHLWRLVRSGQLLVVENDILQAINERIDQAFAEVDGLDTPPAAKLRTYGEEPPELGQPRPG